jgi:hypothetical protein
MGLKRTDLVLTLYLCLAIARGCKFNDCICGDDTVICEITDVADPFFSRDEEIEVESLQITDSQRTWFSEKCGTFPRLQTVQFRDKTGCPLHSCVQCL